ncbi:MAG: Zn-ribbon domain-containing OB-fold protein [Candidatus Syntropharchaeia archaeon]
MSEYITALEREIDSKFRLTGAECLECGTINYPFVRVGSSEKIVCRSCGKRSDFKPKKLSRRGKIYSFIVVKVAPMGFENEVPYAIAVVELDDGVRVIARLTDVTPNPEVIKVGMRVRAVFRKLREIKNGEIEYGFKFKPEEE